ncbi:MAG: hypothetical protein JST26_02515 [Bacteroidetes bacterium]|nr:hypothetical protein [Bacteroidota bacterium]
MMKTITFNPNGSPLLVKAIFLGNMNASYSIELRQKGSNDGTVILKGDNTNPADDQVTLPVPVADNNGRRLLLDTGFYGLTPDVSKNYEIRMEVYQDNKLLGFENETGTFTGNGQYSLLFIQLISA